MSFKDTVVAAADGNFIPFGQAKYTKSGVGEQVSVNLAALEEAERVPGLCVGLSAAFLVCAKNALTKDLGMKIQQIVQGFIEYIKTGDGAAIVGSVQRDVDLAQDPVHAETALADFFSEGLGFRSLKHGGVGATLAGVNVSYNDVSQFVGGAPGFDTLTFGTAGRIGHCIAAINLDAPGYKPQIIIFEPNFGFTQLVKDPRGQMTQFVTAYFSSKYGNAYVNQPFVFSRYS